MIYYLMPLHLQPVFIDLGHKESGLPKIEKAAIEAISLPMYPELPREQQEKVVKKIVEVEEKIIEFYS